MASIVRISGLLIGGFAASYLAFHYGPTIFKERPPADHAGMVWVPGGTFSRGSDNPKMRDAQPVHLATVDGFWMDHTAVTNEEFARFVEATGYVTIAEHVP